MRTTEERIYMMHERAAELGREARRRRVRIAEATGTLAAFVLVVAAAFMVPAVLEGATAGSFTGGMYASIFSSSPVLGYIVIGIIAFLLGGAVTVFCFRLKQWENLKNSEEGYDRTD